MKWALEVKGVSHWFGEKKVLSQIDLTIAPGQIVAIVGPSGCGKSTLLRAILGTHPPCRGEVWTNGRQVERPNRDVGIVYQHYSLFDFLTAEQNVLFGLAMDRTSWWYRTCCFPFWWRDRRKLLAESRNMLQKVGLEKAAKLYPHEMSGGMRQRVSIAQALLMEPQILLLDEPFGALDEATREELQLMLLRLYEENQQAKQAGRRPPYTILIVTHELNEALYVSDRVIGLSQYHQDGAHGASIVYDRPAPVFRPDDPREFREFFQQKEELREAVFDPENLQHHSEYVSFWQHHEKQA